MNARKLILHKGRIKRRECIRTCTPLHVNAIRVSEGVEAIGDEAFSFAGSGNGSEGEYVTYLTDEAYEKNKAYVYQEDEKAGFVNVYLPSTLKRVGANVFYGAYVDGIYME